MAVEFQWHGPYSLRDANLKEIIAKEKVIHLKGFAKGIDFADEHNYAERTKLLSKIFELCNEFSPEDCAIVFDGDNFRSDSYTALILHIIESVSPLFSLWAVVSGVDQFQRFEDSWSKAGKLSCSSFKINVVAGSLKSSTTSSKSLHVLREYEQKQKALADGSKGAIRLELSKQCQHDIFHDFHCKYVTMGDLVLCSTESDTVLCAGGGQILREELIIARQRGIHFHVFNIWRRNPRTGDVDWLVPQER